MNADAIEAKRAKKREWMRRYREKHNDKILERRRENRRIKMEDPVIAEKEKAGKKEYNRQYNSDPEIRARRRKKDLWRKYGLTEDEFNDMRIKQDNLCLICGIEMSHAVVDHCHESGAVRGLLCKDCNTGLGHFKDNRVSLQRAIGYLERAA